MRCFNISYSYVYSLANKKSNKLKNMILKEENGLNVVFGFCNKIIIRILRLKLEKIITKKHPRKILNFAGALYMYPIEP